LALTYDPSDRHFAKCIDLIISDNTAYA